ncbi:MAG: hypothetical protein F6K54_24330 [Okeania sp. SIO3B5]|uniref:hypothetical protein n=1 Tax=Okeania sp. SIO3B5 TaxID=2607811 RepID=UPI00140112C0|nr:hypothetical protein [Okeania sp. SIO3B5]NEO55918.1 hypothetical protein [Okeania sp. SIO3B5]
MNIENEKSKTQRTRRNEGHFSNSEDDFNSSTGVDEPSNQPGVKSVGLDGKNWQGGDSIKPFVCGAFGKILDRLIDSWEDRKKEAKDCLAWYNAQVDKCDNEIELLRLIKNDLVQAPTEEK